MNATLIAGSSNSTNTANMQADDQAMTPALSRIVQTYTGPTLISRLVELLGCERDRDAAKSYLISLLKSKTLNMTLLKLIESPLSPV